ncbi:MAG TPA: VCBS repeat-containing protein [Fimbriiglobus sp.]|jgi:uncharacterized delta-60 repeat protein
MVRQSLQCHRLEERLAPSAGPIDPTLSTIGGTVSAQQPDGKYVFADSDTGEVKIGRLLADMTVDTSFGTNGTVTISTGSTTPAVTGIAVSPGGSIVVEGESSVPNQVFWFTLRVTDQGQPDPTFGTGGVVSMDVSAPADRFYPHDFFVAPDESIITVGRNIDERLTIAKLTPVGTSDASFGTNGRTVVTDLTGGASVIGVQPGTSRLIATAQTLSTGPDDPPSFAVVGLTSDGNLDPTFGTAGESTVALVNPTTGDQSNSPTTVLFRSDGVMTLVGTVERKSYTKSVTKLPAQVDIADIGLVRFRADGTLDANFGDGGHVVVNTPDANVEPDSGTFLTSIFGVSEGSAGSFLIYTDYIQKYVTRVQSFGEVDLSFGTLGSNLTDGVADPESPVISFTPVPNAVQASGTPVGGGVVLDLDPGTQATQGDVTYFPLSPLPVRTATADVNGDGVPDLIGGSGPGGGPHVIVIDGKTHQRMAEFFAFEQSFTGGVNVAAGDVNGDGKADIVITPDQGGGPVVAVYDGAKLAAGFNNDAQLARFFGIDDPAFRGGARAAAGDVNGDGKADLLVSAGFQGGPREALFDGAGLAPTGAPPKLVPDFFAFEDTLRNGAYVTLGDLTGDGMADLVFGGGPGGAPRVRVFDGAKLLAAGSFQSLDEIPSAQEADFFAADSTTRGGIRLAVGTVDGKAALITGSGENDPAQVRVFSAPTLFGSASPAPDQTLDVFGGEALADGVFVG